MSCHHRRGQHRQSSSTSSLTRMMRASSWPGLLLLLAALLVLQPCGAPPINPGQSEELKLPVVHDTIKVNLGSSDSKDYRGSSLCHIGDLDGNGVDDMVLGAYGDDTTAADAGAIVLLYMQKQVEAPVISWRKITSGLGGFNIRLQAMDYFGASVAGVGDVDGDGMEDMVVGALGDDEAALNAGAVYLLYLQRGDAAQPVRDAVKITGGKGGFDATMTQNSYFGSSVAYLGDVDGNGVGDIAVGAYGEDKLAGVVYILFLQNSATTPVLGWYKIRAKTAGFQFSLLANDAFGTSVAGLGDVDGDGVPDLAVGAYMDKDYQPGGGAVYVLLLQRMGVPVRGVVSGLSPVRAAVKIAPGQRGFGDTSLQPNAYFGASVAGFKDLDGDGVPELMVGTIGDGRANPNAGAVHLLYLGLNATGDLLPSVKDWRKITTGVEGFKSQLPANTNFGAAIAELPDLSGDNQTEIAVGCYVASNASIYLLYKNSLTALVESPPQIYSVSPAVLDTQGGQNVTMTLSIDTTEVDFSKPYTLDVSLGTLPCTDPTLRPYDGVAVTATAMIGPQGSIIAGPSVASNKAAAPGTSAQLVPFPAVLPPETTQRPFLLSCVSSPGVGAHLPAQATIAQGGADIPLLMANAASYAAPVVAAITATGSAAKGGFDVRVSGRHFGPSDFQPMVLVQDTPCEATVWESDASVVCQGAPPGLGTVQVKVSVGGQTSVAVPTAEITYDAPVLLGWNITVPKKITLPIFGGFSTDLFYSPSTAGKEELQIWGKNFGPPGAFPRVALGGNGTGPLLECADAVVVSDALITCTTPSGRGANLSLAVSIGGLHARLDRNFSYGAPLLATIVPETANTDGGDLVIMGRNFGHDAALLEVLIGEEPCRDVKMVYEHQLLTCKYPAGGGKELPLTVSLAGQTNTPPRALSYADTYGQRTVESVFLLAGESFEAFDGRKQAVFEQILFRALDNDPTVSVTDDAVHVTNVTSPITGASTAASSPMAPPVPGARPPTASQLVSSDELQNAFISMDFEGEQAGDDATAGADNMAGGRRKRIGNPRPDTVLVAVDIAAANAKVAASIQAWLRSKEQQARLTTYLNSQDTGLRVLELQMVSTAITTELYCPPGQQQQDIGSEGGDKACFACPVGTYQPLRSKAPCMPCPFGADCLRQGMEYPVAMPGFWRQPLPRNDAVKIDPYFIKYRIYECNPPTVCLGGVYSNCTDGHEQGSPLCAICEEGFYASGSGLCKACGPKRAIQITVCFALALAMAAFFALLYFFVRPGADIDEVAGTVKDQLLEGPKGKAFNRELSMSYFLSNTLSRHLASRLSDMTHLPDLWSKAKISITFFQIIASLNVAYTVPWPAEFSRLLHKLNVLNLNLLNIPGMAYSCVQPMDYFAEFFLAAFFPVVLTLFFVLLHALGVRVIRRKVAANIDVVRSLEAQSLQMKNQLIKKMRLISVRMLRKRRPMQPSARQPPPTLPHPPPPPAPSAQTTATNANTTDMSTAAPATSTGTAPAFTAAFPPIQEDRTLAFSPQAAFAPPPPPPASPTPVGQLEHQASSASTAPSEPVLDAQGSGMYHPYASQASTASSLSPGTSPKRAGSVSPPVLPMPSQGVSRFSSSPPPLRGALPPPPAFAHVSSSSPTRPARSSPPPLPIPTTSTFAAVVAPGPSPAVCSAVIDIFSPRPQQLQQAAEGEGAMVGASGMSSLTSDRLGRSDETASQASGGAGGATSTTATADTGSNSNSNSNGRPKVRKKATFSDMVTAAVAGEQGVTTVAAVLQPAESMGKDESLGGRSGVTTTTGAGSLVGLGSEDEEDGESIVAIKHKLTLLEKQQDVEKFSIERYTSRLITFWFWIILLIYPAVSRVVLEGVNCRTLDDGRRYLVTDFTIDCQSQYYLNHLPLIAPAVLLYPVGIPLMFFLLLRYKRDCHTWDENLSFLYKAYRREYWWFEVYELLRKLFLTGLIIFIAAGTATQLAIACIVCAVTMCLHMRLRPYEEPGDDILQGFALAEVLLITYCALLLKLDLTGSDAVSVRIFDVLLIGTNAVVVLGIMPASFYIQSRQYLRKFLHTRSLSLAATMKRELAHRCAVTLALLLALWASLANNVYDPLTATITAGCLLMLARELLTALYFFHPVNDRLPLRYRILAVLAPRDCAPEGGEAEGEPQKEMFASTMSILNASASSSYRRSGSGAGGGGGGKGHLAKLNARKLEAIRAAGLSTAELERQHRTRNLYGARRRTESADGGAADAQQPQPQLRPSLGGPQRSSLDSSLAMDGSLSGEASVAEGGQAPDRSWLGRLVLAPWTAVVRHRRLLDPVMAVLMVDLAVMCADEGKGSANYARLVMLGVAALFTIGLCVFPHVKDGHPPRVSPLRVGQCLFALSAVNVLLASFQDAKRLRRAEPSATAYDLALIALAAALGVAALCALHATAGIVRGLRATAPGGYAGMGDGGGQGQPAADAKSGGGGGSLRGRALSRRDSVYGGSSKARIYKDLVLLLAIGLVVAGLVLTRPRRHGRVVPVCMMVGLGLLFSYKPLRALREAEEEFVGQLVLLRILVTALWPRHGLRRGRRGWKGSWAGGDKGKGSEHEDMFDEHDLSAATRPEALAAEVIRLRRKVAALEERLDTAAADGDPGRQG